MSSSEPSPDPVPRPAPHLAPGLRVVRRGLDHLQVGLYDGRRALLPRTEGVQRAIAELLERRFVSTDPATARLLDRLERSGCLAWQEDLRATAAVVRLGDLAVPGLPDVDGLLGAAGIAITSSVAAADVVLVVSAGELERERLDPLVRRRTSHLVVRLVDGGALLGPFVVPGTSPCLRCVDAQHSVRDPDHVTVTARYARATSRGRPDGVPDLDPALVAVALAWAVRDLVAHLGGREPSTWSRTLFLAPEPARRDEQQWFRDPRCGCCWSPGAPPSGTMGA